MQFLISEFGTRGEEFWTGWPSHIIKGTNWTIWWLYINHCHYQGIREYSANLTIDGLHKKSQRSYLSHYLYNRKVLHEEFPEANMVAFGQTCAWVSKHKKIVYAMHKTLFHFYLHWLIKCRNTDIEHYYKSGKSAKSQD